MHARAWKVSPLLFASGACGLVYQIAWQRELRLVFGGSTAASAAVVAIFIGGLGAGSYLLGKRADASERPLVLYALLEAGIATFAALSPALLWLVRAVYVRAGGTASLGLGIGTALRLVLSTLVLLVPTLLMGGTLCAAGRSVQHDDDPRRRSVALLYGANTLGAVTGCGLATFVLLERLGTRQTLWAACAANAAVAGCAWLIGRRRIVPRDAPTSAESPEEPARASSPAWFVLLAAAAVGFVFFLMELVWYRVLSPLLGGSVFTFGLILMVALLGIGVGGLGYALLGRRRPATLGGLSISCLLEAAFIAAPYALGDRVALLALVVRPEEATASFPRLVLGWFAVTCVVVLPASIVAGAQFPLLVALLGRGAKSVGRQIGAATACNTAGAIAGALLGGFGLLPALGAEGAWRLGVGVLVLLGLTAVTVGWRSPSLDRPAKSGLRSTLETLAAFAVAAPVIAMLTATGPTSAWRHSPIGAGRVDRAVAAKANTWRAWVRDRRRNVLWQAEGIESSVALDGENGLVFLVSGKADGNSIGDAPTQVMGGLVGALLHPKPKNAMVVGLGTGSTAGWLGQVPSIERVDVAELEPAMLEVGRACALVNRDVLSNPKVHVAIGDARELLLTTRRHYDIVFSEPSNPYRAGVASLFTREYYAAIAERLEPGGLFLQWVQAYEIDETTLRTIFATALSVFPVVETWKLATSDLLLVATREPPTHDVRVLRERVASEPFAAALRAAWRVDDLESVLAHHVGRPSLAAWFAEKATVNTDDKNVVEFGFARSVGRRELDIDALERHARSRGEHRPVVTNGDVDWDRVAEARLAQSTAEGSAPSISEDDDADRRHRVKAHEAHVAGNPSAALSEWRAQAKEPVGPVELAIVAEATADAADGTADGYIERLRALQPTEAEAVEARLLLRRGRMDEACTLLAQAFEKWRNDPWASGDVMYHAMTLAPDLGSKDPACAARIYGALGRPFAMHAMESSRLRFALTIAGQLVPTVCADSLRPFEPYFPWDQDLLIARRDCYVTVAHPFLGRAEREVEEFAVCDGPSRLRCW